MSTETLLVFAAAYLAVVILPGPAVTALFAHVLARGTRSAPAFIAGIATGAVVWLLVATAGLASLAAMMGDFFVAVRYAGAAYLLYLAWKLWRAEARPAQGNDIPKQENGGRLFLAGLAINLGNPKALVFFVALLPSVVRVDALTLSGTIELAAIVVAVVAGVFAAYAALAARARRLLRSPRAVRLANRSSGVALALAAVAIAAR